MAESIYSSNDFGLGGRVVARASELRDNRTYRKLKAESERRGVPLEILTDSEFAAATGQPAPEIPTPDENGIVADSDGVRYLAIRESDARDHRKYIAARERAKELGVDLVFTLDEDGAA